MSSPISDNDFDSLINDAGLNLDDSAKEPAPVEVPPGLPQQDLSFFGKIPVSVTLEVASTEITLKELMDVDAGSVIALDKLAGEPLDVKVNGALFAKAEVVVM
ncbi:MAG: FliM/FliN family flagellar motor switch protein, partial [Pseudomonas sp.]|nr:FliM/FliN family flagellar motor switch protein [Pseudomonas sp.]